VGAHLAPEEPEEDPLVLGVFKPKDGVREKLRETLHNVLAVEMAERAKEVQFEEAEGVTSVPNAVTISKNTRVEENRQREPSRNFVSRARKLPASNEVSQDSNRYVTIQRGGEPTEPTFSEADTSNQSSEREEDASFEDNSSSVFRPTISDNLISIDTTPTPFFPTFSPSPTTTTTTPLPVIVLTEEPRQRQQRPRKLEIISLEAEDNALEQTEATVQLGSGRGRSRAQLRPQTRLQSRPAPVSRQRAPTPVQLGGRARAPIQATSPRTTPTAAQLFQTNFQDQPPLTPAPVRQRVLSAGDLAAALISSGARGRGGSSSSSGSGGVAAGQPEYEYEYYYEYLDDDDSGHVEDYDLVPLANKVRIMSDGLPQCYDVGVFPHPFSCKKFVNCYRNPGTGIVGSIYQCPSYLAFDPVGGRCNWVNEIVCTSGQSSSSPARQRL